MKGIPMIRITSLRYMIALVALLFIVSSCEQDPGSPEVNTLNNMPNAASSTSYDAHPAFVYTRSEQTTSKGSTVTMYSVSVSDSDGTDASDVYDCASSTVKAYSSTWSASGASASFVEGPVSGSGTYYIKAVDVSVATSGKSAGKAQGSNVRTVHSSSSYKILAQAWSQSSSVTQIAFVTESSSEFAVYLVSTSGGTPTKIYSIASSSGSLGSTITWSNDASELAIIEKSGSTYSIKVISTSGSVNATLESGTYQAIDKLEWSHSGSNKIAYSAVPTGVTAGYGGMLGRSLYTINTSSGSTGTQLITGSTQYDQMTTNGSAYWSPNNSTIIYKQSAVSYTFSGSSVSSAASSKTYKVVVSTAAASDQGQLIYGDWKTPS